MFVPRSSSCPLFDRFRSSASSISPSPYNDQSGSQRADQPRALSSRLSAAPLSSSISKLYAGRNPPSGIFITRFHIATDVGSMVVLAVDVNNEGRDLHAMLPLAEQIEADYEVRPQEWLADGGCTSVENIEKMSKRDCKVIAPVRQRSNPDRKPSDPRPGDSEAILEWRARMETEQAIVTLVPHTTAVRGTQFEATVKTNFSSPALSMHKASSPYRQSGPSACSECWMRSECS
jgi:hypothetical protein